MEEYWVLSQSGENCLQVFLKEVSAQTPDQDLCPRPQIKRPRNEGAWVGGANMCNSLTGPVGLCP